MTHKVSGRLKIVSKYAGLKLKGDDDWYNYHKKLNDGELRTLIRSVREHYVDENVVLSLNDRGKYTSISLHREAESQESKVKQDNKISKPSSKQDLIVRQNALTQARGLLEILSKHKSYENETDVLADFFKMAKKCEKWVMRNDELE